MLKKWVESKVIYVWIVLVKIVVDKIEEYILIALVNFEFKIIAKVLANRGFLKGHNVTKWICIASKPVNMLEYKSFGDNVPHKVDIHKVFDTFDYDFLLMLFV